MIPIGYMAKRVVKSPTWLATPDVRDIYSVSGCVSEDFTDYINLWKHNGYWLFDSPEVIRVIAQDGSLNLGELSLFYYEAYELEFDGEHWKPYLPEPSFETDVVVPSRKELEGFDVVTFWCGNSPEHSPLSCNSLAEKVRTNSHCLFDSLAEAETNLKNGVFNDCEPGPYRIFAVYSTDWPQS
jgi:hypothetical protein